MRKYTLKNIKTGEIIGEFEKYSQALEKRDTLGTWKQYEILKEDGKEANYKVEFIREFIDNLEDALKKDFPVYRTDKFDTQYLQVFNGKIWLYIQPDYFWLLSNQIDVSVEYTPSKEYGTGKHLFSIGLKQPINEIVDILKNTTHYSNKNATYQGFIKRIESWHGYTRKHNIEL